MLGLLKCLIQIFARDAFWEGGYQHTRQALLGATGMKGFTWVSGIKL